MVHAENITLILIDGTVKNNDDALHEFYTFSDFFGDHLNDFRDIFSEIIFLTSDNIPYEYRKEYIKYLSLPPTTFDEYQILSVYGLDNYTNADYVVTCQLDGFPLHREKWKNEFLDYDYVGAPWGRHIIWQHMLNYYVSEERELYSAFPVLDNIPRKYLVGNSGFCLRSRKFLEVSKKSSYPFHLCPVHRNHLCTTPVYDDWFFSFTARDFFDLHNINFASPELASEFSLEASHNNSPHHKEPIAPFYTKNNIEYLTIKKLLQERRSFGFHGKPILFEFFGINQ